jgi:antiviral helicase SKI2
LSLKPSPPPTSISFIRSGISGHATGYSEVDSSPSVSSRKFLHPGDKVVNPPVQTGLTSTSSDRRPAPTSNFVRGKSGYAPFWPGGLDSLVAKPNCTSAKDGVTVTKGLRTIPPGLKRGLRLSSEKNRDPNSSELHDLGEYENEAESPVTNALLVLVAICVLMNWQ